MIPLNTYLHYINLFPDFLLSDSVVLSNLVAGLGHVLVITQFPIKGEVHFANKGMEALHGDNFLQISDKTQFHLLRSYPDFREVVLLLTFVSICVFVMGAFILSMSNRNDTKKVTLLDTGSAHKHLLSGRAYEVLEFSFS